MTLYRENKDDVFHIIPTTAAVSTVETFLVERYKMYKWLYYHPHVMLSDRVLSCLIRKLLDWSRIPRHPLGNLLRIEDFHYSNYICQELPFDDQSVLEKLRQAFIICKRRFNKKGKWKYDIAMANALLRIVLFREKFARTIFKNIAEYNKFDLEVKNALQKSKCPFLECIPRSPMLNFYAENVAGEIGPGRLDRCRFAEVIPESNQVLLEASVADFEPYASDITSTTWQVAGSSQSLVGRHIN